MGVSTLGAVNLGASMWGAGRGGAATGADGAGAVAGAGGFWCTGSPAGGWPTEDAVVEVVAGDVVLVGGPAAGAVGFWRMGPVGGVGSVLNGGRGGFAAPGNGVGVGVTPAFELEPF